MSQNENQTPKQAEERKLPSLAEEAWNLAWALADFVADGCRTLRQEQYRQRLEICDQCPSRLENRCAECGCHLGLKVRGRAFQCPLGKWPSAE